MKNKKRIPALIGVILLAGMYLATLIFALIDSPWAYDMFKLCLGFTIVVPVLLYVYMLIARVLGGSGKPTASPSDDDGDAQI